MRRDGCFRRLGRDAEPTLPTPTGDGHTRNEQTASPPKISPTAAQPPRDGSGSSSASRTRRKPSAEAMAAHMRPPKSAMRLKCTAIKADLQIHPYSEPCLCLDATFASPSFESGFPILPHKSAASIDLPHWIARPLGRDNAPACKPRFQPCVGQALARRPCPQRRTANGRIRHTGARTPSAFLGEALWLGPIRAKKAASSSSKRTRRRPIGAIGLITRYRLRT